MESTNITHTSFEDTCRVCMTKNGALVDIFKCQNRNISDEINYCSGVVVNASDNLPPNICVVCLKQLSVACNFKQKCVKADEVFRQVLVVEQVEYLEDYFQVTEQEHDSIYVAGIDKENTEIFSSLEDKTLSSKDELQEQEKVHSQDKRQELDCQSKFNNTYGPHLSVKRGGQSKGKIHVTATPKPNVKIDYEAINSRDDLINTLIKEIHLEENTEEFPDTVEDYINSDNLSDNEDSDFSLRYDESSDTKETTEQNRTLGKLQKRAIIENIEVRDDKNLKTKEIIEQISTPTVLKEIKIIVQDGLVKDNKDLKRKEITEQKSILKTLQNSKKRDIQDIEIDETKNIPFISTPKISKKEEITEQKSTLKTVQNRTNIKNLQDLEDRLKIDKIHDKVMIKKCMVCDISFDSIQAYGRHRRMVHQKPVTCEVCNKQLSNPNSYKVHMVTHNALATQYPCNICDFKTPYKSTLKTHMNIHTATKKYICDYCKRLFLHRYNLILHISRVHLKKDEKKDCSICKKKFNVSYLKRHIKLHLRGKQKTQPTVTTKKIQQTKDVPNISNMAKITEQTSTLNTVQKSTQIKIQDVEIGGDRMDKIDVPSNVKSRLYKCSKCDMMLYNLKAYTFHRSTVHDEVFTCEICQKQVRGRIGFNSHMQVHKRPQYICQVCEFQTANKSLFLKHMKKHPGIHNFKLKINDIPSNTPKIIREEITEHLSTLRTVQERTKNEIQEVEYIERLKMDKIKDSTFNVKPRTIVLSLPLKTVQGRTKNEIQEIENIERLKMDQIKDSTFKVKSRTEQLSTLNTVQERTKKENVENIKRLKKKILSRVRPKVKCEICGKQLRPHHIKTHILTHTRPQYVCEVCKYNTTNKALFQKHMKIHSDANKYTCDYCKNKFTRKVGLLRHILRTEICRCTICNIDFYTSGELRKHEREVHKENHVCEICGKQYDTKPALSTHKLLHGTRLYQCDVCGYKTVNKFDLIRHLNIHSGKNEYTCDHCKQKFNFKHNLSLHMRRHPTHLKNQEKKLKCTTCDKRYYNNYQLNTHILGHLKITSYSCELCPSNFIQYPSYKYHMKKHHNVVLPKLPKGKKRRY